MRQTSIYRYADMRAGRVINGEYGPTVHLSRLLIVAIMLCMMTGCKKEPDTSERKAILTSYVWDNIESCGTSSPETGLYTCIFMPNGTYRTYYKAYVTFSSSWRLVDYFTISVNNTNADIVELNDDRLTMKIPGSFYGLFDIKCTDKYRSLPITNITSVGVSGLSKTSATLHGYLRTCEDADVSAEYGVSSGYGSSTDMEGNPVQGVANKVVEVDVSGLMPETTYRYRLKAVTSSGTYYGEERRFTTFNAVSLTDVDDNEYNTLTIGPQTWMVEPLKTTRYNDGTPIPDVSDNFEWAALESPAFCWYMNDPDVYKDVYGALYNWYAVSTGKLCPTGWHVPTGQDFNALTGYLGANAADKLTQGHYDYEKLISYLEASNETGFSATPVFIRYDSGFNTYEDYCQYWCSTEFDDESGVKFTVSEEYAGTSNTSKYIGLPVRCIKDL
jgi:uncharacterized protein (TIGR02145 family)